MVSFLVQNSLGALWMGIKPTSKLAEGWSYFVRDADRTAVPAKSVREITFLDPACGSGHFLIEAFDLFYAMYLEEGTTTEPAEICASIFAHNLYGVDIDERAVQFAAMSLVMKAKEKAPDFVPRRVNLVSTNIRLPTGKEDLEAFLAKHPEDAPLKSALLAIFEGLAHADELGSLLQIAEPVEKELRSLKAQYETAGSPAAQQALWSEYAKPVQGKLPLGVATYEAWHDRVLDRIRQHFNDEAHGSDLGAAFFGEAAAKGISLVELLGRRYDVVAANPPYMGSKNMGAVVKGYVERYFAAGKRDLYAAFIQRCRELTAEGGRVATVAQQSWLFLPSFASLRARKTDANDTSRHGFSGILRCTTIETIAHLGRYAFSDIGNAVVAPLMCVFRNSAPPDGHRLWACRLTAPRPSTEQAGLLREAVCAPLSPLVSRPIQTRFLAIPGTPICYWLTERLFELLTKRDAGDVSSVALVYPGLKTGADERFLRFFWECPTGVAGWVPYSKGGAGCERWYGQTSLCVDWRHARTPFREYHDSRQPYSELYLQDGYTYSSAAKSLGVRRLVSGSIFGSKGPGIFPKVGAWVVPLLCGRLSTYFVRAMTVGLDILVENVRTIPLPQADDARRAFLSDITEPCVALKRQLIDDELTQRTYQGVWPAFPNASLHEFYRARTEHGESVAAILHALEGLLEREVFAMYELSDGDVRTVLDETGTPAGWFPLVEPYTTLPNLPGGVALSPAQVSLLGEQPRRQLSDAQLAALKDRLGALYEAGFGGNGDVEEQDTASDEPEDEEAVVGSAAKIPIPAETFLEDLSRKLEVHPISVYWMLRELRDERAIVSVSGRRAFVEDYLTTLVLQEFGHEWPTRTTTDVAVGTVCAEHGVIPITDGTHAPTIVGRIRARFVEVFGADHAATIEREFVTLVGKPLPQWLGTEFFSRHVAQFKKRPIVWQIQSEPASNGRRRGRGLGPKAPAFSCLIYYHRLDLDLLPKIRKQYVGPLRVRLQTEALGLERANERTASQDERRVELEECLEELRLFDARIDEVSAGGFGSAAADAFLAKETPDKWTSLNGRADAASFSAAFRSQERRYAPDLNNGVRINVAPLQRAGLLAIDVLAAKDVEKAIADRAEWRADERRWCREGKLSRPGWWTAAVEEVKS
jgi:SAM-dependent methyltransferase